MNNIKTELTLLCYSVDQSSQPLKIRLGEFDVSNTEERYKFEELDVDRVILHPSYINTTLLNDIALLRLAKRAKKRANVDIVCMPKSTTDETSFSGQQCVVTGWGRKGECTLKNFFF